ncbi:hypothetical protein [Legionella nagasakiensis]|uniref:hypothetical protein n=1 Tax=Legionella nagasakiensis TaxID=535290 RepID=UPI001056A30B|nr:hypothetical protein [Legionella nagasakiensis]
MANNLTLSKLIGLGILVLPMACWSETSTNNQEMAKDEWLQKIKEIIPEPICKGFMEDASVAGRLKELKISYQDCVDKIPAITEKCQKKYYNDLPAMINQKSAAKWGRTIGECIGMDFAVNYLYSEGKSAKGTSAKQP